MRAVVILVAICVLAAGAAFTQTFQVDNRKDGEMHISWSNDRFGAVKVEIRSRGEISFTDDDRDVSKLSPNGYLNISEERRGGTDRRLELRSSSDGKTVERRYFVDSREQAFDQEGRAWLGELLPRVIRRSGIAAEARVARILAAQGPTGVLNEISLLDSDYVAAKYFRLLFAANPSGPVLRDALAQAGRQIGSDHELGSLLRNIARKAVADSQARNAYFDAVRSIGSDFELRHVLSAATDETLPADAIAQALRTSRAIGSDFELASLLVDIGGKHMSDAAVRSAFFDAFGSIGSDFEQRRVLTKVVELSNLSSETLSALLRASTSIGSDHELAFVLTRVAERHRLQGALRDQYLNAAHRIGSDHEKNRVLSTLAKNEQLK
jgi:hypothetical protein